MSTQTEDGRLATVARDYTGVTATAAQHAADVDARARFPQEAIAAARSAELLSAAVPRSLGGGGATMRELVTMCSSVAQACASSGMVLAMHHIQIACIARHGGGSRFFQDYLREVARRQTLLASVTSEVGTGGETRSSICAVEVGGGRFTLDKDATTVSYGEHAEDLLVTCRRAK